MGADMVIVSLVIPEGHQPDFVAAHRAVNAVAAADIENPDEFYDVDPESEAGLQGLRKDLHCQLDELEQALDGREFTWTTVRGASVYVTGGLSTGDSPTEAFEIVNRLRAVRGV